MSEFAGLATGIGSLPHKDATEAVDLIFKYLPEIPFWPQLPKRAPAEGMVAQFAQNIPNEEKRLEEFYEKIINKDLEYFKITEDYAQGLYAFRKRLREQPELLDKIKFIKAHITGPFTFAASIKDEDGTAYLHKPIFLQAFIEGLTMKAFWQIAFLKEFGKKMIIFLDEPYLGCFGSAYTPINREDVIKGLTQITTAIKSENVLTGVHCCGNTDWSIFTDVKSIDMINFDAFGFLDKFILYADSLKAFLQRGGIICWGVAPTQEFDHKITSDLLLSKLKDGFDILVKKGIDRQLLNQQMLISPSCGLGSLDINGSAGIFKLLSETSQKIRHTS